MPQGKHEFVPLRQMIQIGKIAATHSLQGAMVLVHNVGNSKWLKKDDALFLELNKGSFIPFFVSQARATGTEEYIINLDDVATLEEAKKLAGKNVYVQEDILSKYAEETPMLWLGFKMIDKQNGELGKIEDVMQAPAQWLAQITYKEKEVLVPLLPQIIKSVNLKTKTIQVDLPEGLLEVYL